MAKALIVTKPVSPLAVTAARLSIGSAILFVLLLGSLHLLEPEFDPTWRFISEYALGQYGWMMHVAFLALATSLASAAIAISSQVRGDIDLVQERLGAALLRSDGDNLNEMVAPATHIASNLRASVYAGAPE